LLRRAHSLTGVVPLAVFVVAHLARQGHALDGPLEHERALAATPWFDAHPGVVIVFVLLPLVFHALSGLAIARTSRPNVQAYTGSGNWRYVSQRLTGVATLVYLAVHVRQTWFARQLGELSMSDHYGVLVETLSVTAAGLPWRAALELVGLAAVCFHLSSGLWGFGCTWGLTTTRSQQRRSALAFGLFGLLLFAYAANLSLHLSTGARVVERGLDGAPARPSERGARA
jgi:succinate dehydrogenase / fumarate reductase cytochrome b subunit